jgi:hypothetical protein
MLKKLFKIVANKETQPKKKQKQLTVAYLYLKPTSAGCFLAKLRPGRGSLGENL